MTGERPLDRAKIASAGFCKNRNHGVRWPYAAAAVWKIDGKLYCDECAHKVGGHPMTGKRLTREELEEWFPAALPIYDENERLRPIVEQLAKRDNSGADEYLVTLAREALEEATQ